MYLHFLILTLLKAFKGERSSSAVFHLLKGKRTSQTIQDGYTYGVHPFFNTYKTLSREAFDHVIEHFLRQDVIREEGVNQSVLTSKGEEEWEHLKEGYSLPQGLNGWQAGLNSDLFWTRLSLVVQTLSHLLNQVKTYVAITNDPVTLDWGKSFLLSSSLSRHEFARRLYKELTYLLSTRPALQQTIVVHRLTGYQKQGVTYDQLSQFFGIEKDEVMLNFKACLDTCVTTLIDDSKTYPILSKFIDSENRMKMTQSAQETFKWFKKGFSMEAIAERRRLKPSTIQDHLIEIARVEPREVSHLLPEDQEDLIRNVLQTHTTRRLSELKKELPEDISYFHIRLALVLLEVSAHA